MSNPTNTKNNSGLANQLISGVIFRLGSKGISKWASFIFSFIILNFFPVSQSDLAFKTLALVTSITSFGKLGL